MLNFEGIVDRVVLDGCDEVLATGIKTFLDVLSRSSSYSLLSKRYSVFNLLKDHVDRPYLDFESRFRLNQCGFSLQPSRMKYPGYLVAAKKVHYARLSRHKKIIFSLRIWEDRIRSMIKDESIIPIECYESMESLLNLVTMLRLIPQKKESIRKKKGSDLDYITTNKHLTPSAHVCILCWKPVPQRPLYDKDTAYDDLNKSKSNYCVDHDRSTKEGWANYVRDRRYLESFNYELDKLTRPAESRYNPSAKWYIEESRRLGFVIGSTEIRKLVYCLVRSKLNTKRRQKIYSMKEQGLSVIQISKELKISKQAVSKSLITTAQKIDYVLHSPTRDEATEFGPYFEPCNVVSPRNGKTYPTLKAKQGVSKIKDSQIFSSEELEIEFIYHEKRVGRAKKGR